MELPTTCWVLTGVEDHLIKDASPEWFALWDMPAKESIGKPISILNERAGSDNEASALLMANFNRDGFAKMHCTNARADGTIIGHDIELKKTAKGLLATSTEIASCDALFPSKKRPPSVRDMEVFGTTGHYAKAAATASRRGGGRDDEYFGSDDAEEMPAAAASFTALFAPGTGRLSARDLEVFGPSESHSIPTPAVPVRQPSARDQEYFDDGFESHVPPLSEVADADLPTGMMRRPSVEYPAGVRPGARDLEVFGTAETPEFMVLPAKSAARVSGRDAEYFLDED